MSSSFAKRAKDHIPYCEDQGMDYLAGASKAGVSVQSATIAMPGGGVLTFAAMGMSNMADGLYQVLIHNHTDPTKPGQVDAANRLTTQITVSGAAIPTATDLLDVLVVGRVSGQAG